MWERNERGEGREGWIRRDERVAERTSVGGIEGGAASERVGVVGETEGAREELERRIRAETREREGRLGWLARVSGHAGMNTSLRKDLTHELRPPSRQPKHVLPLLLPTPQSSPHHQIHHLRFLLDALP